MDCVCIFSSFLRCKSKKVENCVSPALCARFERKIVELREKGRVGDALTPHVAYHGTKPENVEKIVETGFLLSKLAANTGNKGVSNLRTLWFSEYEERKRESCNL